MSFTTVLFGLFIRNVCCPITGYVLSTCNTVYDICIKYSASNVHYNRRMMRCRQNFGGDQKKMLYAKISQNENNCTAANLTVLDFQKADVIHPYDPYLADKQLCLIFKMQRSVCQNLTLFHNFTDLNINLIQGRKAVNLLH